MSKKYLFLFVWTALCIYANTSTCDKKISLFGLAQELELEVVKNIIKQDTIKTIFSYQTIQESVRAYQEFISSKNILIQAALKEVNFGKKFIQYYPLLFDLCIKVLKLDRLTAIDTCPLHHIGISDKDILRYQTDPYNSLLEYIPNLDLLENIIKSIPQLMQSNNLRTKRCLYKACTVPRQESIKYLALIDRQASKKLTLQVSYVFNKCEKSSTPCAFIIYTCSDHVLEFVLKNELISHEYAQHIQTWLSEALNLTTKDLYSNGMIKMNSYICKFNEYIQSHTKNN